MSQLDLYLLINLVWHVLELELVRKTTFTKAGSNNNWQMGHEAHLALMETTRMLIYNEFNNFNLINTIEENQFPFHVSSYLSNLLSSIDQFLCTKCGIQLNPN
jgi:hypothetical protein